MDKSSSIRIPSIDALVRLIDTLFSHLNVGLLLYHLEADTEAATVLRLVYVNDAASEMTGNDLTPLVGKTILEAFPALSETELPQIYAGVARDEKAREVGVVVYEDAHLQKRHYAVRAFPVPNQCVGVVFENIEVRKRVEELVMQRTEQLRADRGVRDQHIAALGALMPRLRAALPADLLGELTAHLEALRGPHEAA